MPRADAILDIRLSAGLLSRSAGIVLITASGGKSRSPDHTVDGASEKSITPKQRSILTNLAKCKSSK